MIYALFLGCLAPLRYPGIESSTREILDRLSIEYVDLKGASCCPAPGVFRSFDQRSWLSVGARNLALAEKNNSEILVICNGCYATLKEAAYELKKEKNLKDINNILNDINMEYSGSAEVKHIVEVLYQEVGIEKIKEKVVTELELDLAVHYGCHLLRPSDIMMSDDPEKPHILDEIVEATGAKSLPYMDRMLCCGSGGGVRARSPDVALSMTKVKLDIFKEIGAQAIVTPCPFCHLQYDSGQQDLKKQGNDYSIPVLHISQLLALSFGVDKDKLGLQFHSTPVNLEIDI